MSLFGACLNPSAAVSFESITVKRPYFITLLVLCFHIHALIQCVKGLLSLDQETCLHITAYLVEGVIVITLFTFKLLRIKISTKIIFFSNTCCNFPLKLSSSFYTNVPWLSFHFWFSDWFMSSPFQPQLIFSSEEISLFLLYRPQCTRGIWFGHITHIFILWMIVVG